MPEVMYPLKREMVVYECHYYCDICEEGELVTTNVMLTVDPPLFPHVCTNCGVKVNLEAQFPGINYG